MKVGGLASRNRGQADIVVIPLHCLIRVTLHQLESWGKNNTQLGIKASVGTTVYLNLKKHK